MASKLREITLLIGVNLMLITGFCSAHKVYEKKKEATPSPSQALQGFAKFFGPKTPTASASVPTKEKGKGDASSKNFKKTIDSPHKKLGKQTKKVKDKRNKPKHILARVTVYWARGSGTDKWTAKGMSSTGEKLKCGTHAAVDPEVIPYGSKLEILQGNKQKVVKAVDTGSAVKKRTAAIALAQTPLEKQAPVVDLFFQDKRTALAYARNNPHFQWVKVHPPERPM